MKNTEIKMIATCKLGLESVVKRELLDLGLPVLETLDARVIFSGGFDALVKALLYLRCAERVLLEVGTFPARTFEELFEGVKALQWKPYIPRDAFIHVNGKSAKSALFSVSDCQSITKKAIVENLKAAHRTGVLPETGRKVIVEVGLLRDMATLTLDACGAGLSRRGYRTWNVAAPLSETLGAAMVLLSRYHFDQPLIDPMCGSGTMPIEAAMIAKNMAPGLNRSFAAEEWGFLPEKIWMLGREAARDNVRDVKLNILGCDIDPHSIDISKRHAKKAGVMVNWQVRPVKETPAATGSGVLLCNPPYGERMLGKRETEALYRDMRRAFDGLNGYSKHIITAMADFERVYGKRADKRRKLSNGGITCTLYQYFKERM